MADYHVRPASAADDHALGELLVSAFVAKYAEKMPEVQIPDSRREDLRDTAGRRENGDLQVLVAETAAGELAGTVTIFRPGERSLRTRRSGAAEIRYMAVALPFQGRGVAPLLLEEARRVAAAWGASTLTLQVRRGAHGVARFYQGAGFMRDASDDADLLPEIYLEAYWLPL
jgi:GNAT superfamily N-acetyltransferase